MLNDGQFFFFFFFFDFGSVLSKRKASFWIKTKNRYDLVFVYTVIISKHKYMYIIHENSVFEIRKFDMTYIVFLHVYVVFIYLIGQENAFKL